MDDPPSQSPQPRLRAADLEDLKLQLASARDLVENRDADVLLSHDGGAVGVALLRLVALVVRPCPAAHGPAAAVRWRLIAEAARPAVILVTFSIAAGKAPSSLTATFVRKLVRMQTLQAVARLLADAAGLPLATAAERKAALETAKGVLCLLYAVERHADVAGKKRQEMSDAGPDDRPTGQPPSVVEVDQALRDSAVLEHGAVLIMRLLTAEAKATERPAGSRPGPQGDWEAIKCCLEAFLVNFHGPRYSQLPVSTLAWAVYGPCASHVAMVLGLAVLCELDGGPCYGLPLEVLAAVPSVPGLMLNGLMALTAAAELGAKCHRLNRRAALSMLMRVARLAVAAAEAAAGSAVPAASVRCGSQRSGSAGTSSGDTAAAAAHAAAEDPSAGASRLRGAERMERKDAWTLAMRSLAAARDLLRPSVSVAVLEEAVDWWRLIVALLGVLREVPEQEWLPFYLGTVVRRPLPAFDGLSPPPAAPPEVAAALAGRLLEGLGSLLRLAAEKPTGPAKNVLEGMLKRAGADAPPWRFYAPLLAYGEASQVTALVAAMTRSLRLVASWDRDALIDGNAPLYILAEAVTVLAEGVASLLKQPEPLRSTASTSDSKAAEGQAGGQKCAPAQDGVDADRVDMEAGSTAPQQPPLPAPPSCSPAAAQLRRALCGAARKWLPELLCIIERGSLRACLEGPDIESEEEPVWHLLTDEVARAVLLWLPVLVLTDRRSDKPSPWLPTRQGPSGSHPTGAFAGSDAAADDRGSGQPDQKENGTHEISDQRGIASSIASDTYTGSGISSGTSASASPWQPDRHREVWSLLGGALSMITPQADDVVVSSAVHACLVLAATFPEELRAATVGAGAGTSANVVPPLPPAFLYDRIIPWLLRDGLKKAAAAVTRLAGHLQLWAAGGGVAGMDPGLIRDLREVAHQNIERTRAAAAVLGAAEAAAPVP